MNADVRDVRRITVVVNRDFLEEKSAVKAAQACGVSSINYSSGRAVMLRERIGHAGRAPLPLDAANIFAG